MAGRELVPYEQYAKGIELEIRRIQTDRDHWLEREKFTWRGLFIGTVVALVAFIFLAVTEDQFFSGGWKPGIISYVFIFFPLPVAFVFMGMNFFNRRKYVSYKFTCPHCERELNMNSAWKCGWCGALNTFDKKLRVLFDGCSHKICTKHANAMRCPHAACGENIILDTKSYEKEKRGEHRRINGVATFPGAQSRPPGDAGNEFTRDHR